MRCKLFFGLILFFVGTGFLLAQEREVSGTIFDNSGERLPGVAIIIKGSKNNIGTVSDLAGNYNLKAKIGDVLVYTYIGMGTREYTVTNQNYKRMDVVMHEVFNELEDVVVVGYGTAKKLGTTVSSVVKVAGETLASKPSANVLDALQGKVAGLQILSTSGEPSSIGSIKLHGVSSMYGDSEPLYIVDGSPVTRQAMQFLNPADFESISVLKDASATSIYGTRAANGVIYITTKNGKLNEKGSISISSQYGFSNLASRDFFDSLMNTEEYARYIHEFGRFTEEDVKNFIAQYPYTTRWDRVYFKSNVPSSQINVSARGGGEKVSYFISGGHYKQEGLMYRSGFERYSFRSNLNARLNDWLKLGLNVSAGYTDFMLATAQEDIFKVDDGNLVSRSYDILMPPHFKAVDENGNRPDFMPDGAAHPFYIADKNPASTKGINLTPSGFVSIQPIQNLTLTSQLGIQYSLNRLERMTYPSYEEPRGVPVGKGTVSRTNAQNQITTFTNTAEYKHSIGNHFLTYLIGQESVKYDSTRLGASSHGQISDGAMMISHGSENVTAFDSRIVCTFNSYFGRINYEYASKYFLDFSARRDGSSRFGKNNRYANFWSAGAMWALSKENFLKNVSWLDHLSLKFSTGTSGNAEVLGEYDAKDLVLTEAVYDSKTGYLLKSPGNPDLQWQKQRKTTVGLNAELFKTVSLNVDLYERTISDMIVSSPIPYVNGFGYTRVNGTKLQNRGIDISLSVTPIQQNNFRLTTYASLNYNQERILELPNGLSSFYNPSGDFIYVVGKPTTYFYPIFKGVNSDTGAPEWYVPSDDRTVKTTNDNNITSSFEATTLKQNTELRRTAPFNGGFGFNAFFYNCISLNVDFSFSQGKYIIHRDRYFTERPDFAFIGTSNQSRVIFDYWKNPGDVTRFPAKSYKFTEYDSRLIEDASFIRMKNVMLSYSLPNDIIKEIGFFRDIRVSVTGRNLLTFTKYTGADPEIDAASSLGAYPSTKEYVFGIDITF